MNFVFYIDLPWDENEVLAVIYLKNLMMVIWLHSSKLFVFFVFMLAHSLIEKNENSIMYYFVSTKLKQIYMRDIIC